MATMKAVVSTTITAADTATKCLLKHVDTKCRLEQCGKNVKKTPPFLGRIYVQYDAGAAFGLLFFYSTGNMRK